MKMILRKKFLPALCAATVLLLAACAGGGGNGTNATGATQTGIQACDDYLAKVESCILNRPEVPEQVKATYRSSLEQSRASWKAAAANPSAKAQSESACRQAMETAKPTFDMYCK